MYFFETNKLICIVIVLSKVADSLISDNVGRVIRILTSPSLGSKDGVQVLSSLWSS